MIDRLDGAGALRGGVANTGLAATLIGGVLPGDGAGQAQISAAVDEATSELENELADQEDEATAALEAQRKLR